MSKQSERLDNEIYYSRGGNDPEDSGSVWDAVDVLREHLLLALGRIEKLEQSKGSESTMSERCGDGFESHTATAGASKSDADRSPSSDEVCVCDNGRLQGPRFSSVCTYCGTGKAKP
jgi:hypothetical protein